MTDSELSRIRFVAIDLDGTLFRSDGTPSPQSRKAVKEATRMGVEICISTGRPFMDALRVAGWVGASGPVVASGGAHVLSGGKSNEEWMFKAIDADMYRAVIDLVKQQSMPFYVHVKEGRVIPHEFQKNFGKGSFGVRHVLFKLVGVSPRFQRRVADMGTILDLAGSVSNVCVHGDSSAVKQLESILKKRFGAALRHVPIHGRNLEILDKKANKGDALRVISEKSGIPLANMAAIGDGDNDAEMLQAAGLGVAMANASPVLCEAADRFTLSQDQDGVAFFLRQIIKAKRELSGPR